MTTDSFEIADVSDTAIWVATYRAQETERPDALFHDPLAGRLAGEKGRQIAARMAFSVETAWSVAIRTVIIDDLLRRLAPEMTVVLNLGAGLDTRPYRLDLPPSLRWIEVDYSHIIQLKEDRLRDEKPRCRLERVRLDLADLAARARFLEGLASEKVLVLTEGVTPYLTVDDVASLARDLRRPQFRAWITDYLDPKIIPFLMRGRRRRQMKNAPFRFVPDDWFQFYEGQGWRVRELRYYWDESARVGRTPPAPWWAPLLHLITPPKKREQYRKMSGYALLEPV